jgi:hypothetical protein
MGGDRLRHSAAVGIARGGFEVADVSQAPSQAGCVREHQQVAQVLEGTGRLHLMVVHQLTKFGISRQHQQWFAKPNREIYRSNASVTDHGRCGLESGNILLAT